MKKSKNEKTSDAVDILHRRYVGSDAKKLAELERIRADNAVARKICDLRNKAGLSQLSTGIGKDGGNKRICDLPLGGRRLRGTFPCDAESHCRGA